MLENILDIDLAMRLASFVHARSSLLLFDFDLIDVFETWSILYLFTYEKLPILFDSIVDGSVTFRISIGYKKLQIFSRGKRRERKKKLLRCLSES